MDVLEARLSGQPIPDFPLPPTRSMSPSAAEPSARTAATVCSDKKDAVAVDELDDFDETLDHGDFDIPDHPVRCLLQFLLTSSTFICSGRDGTTLVNRMNSTLTTHLI